jgi:hypothetical protein
MEMEEYVEIGLGPVSLIEVRKLKVKLHNTLIFFLQPGCIETWSIPMTFA